MPFDDVHQKRGEQTSESEDAQGILSAATDIPAEETGNEACKPMTLQDRGCCIWQKQIVLLECLHLWSGSREG